MRKVSIQLQVFENQLQGCEKICSAHLSLFTYEMGCNISFALQWNKLIKIFENVIIKVGFFSTSLLAFVIKYFSLIVKKKIKYNVLCKAAELPSLLKQCTWHCSSFKAWLDTWKSQVWVGLFRWELAGQREHGNSRCFLLDKGENWGKEQVLAISPCLQAWC